MYSNFDFLISKIHSSLSILLHLFCFPIWNLFLFILITFIKIETPSFFPNTFWIIFYCLSCFLLAFLIFINADLHFLNQYLIYYYLHVLIFFLDLLRFCFEFLFHFLFIPLLLQSIFFIACQVRIIFRYLFCNFMKTQNLNTNAIL